MRLPPELEARCLALADPRSVRVARPPRPEPATEAEFQAQVNAYARALGFDVYHTLNSRGSEEGFPDTVIAKPGRMVVCELKVKATPTAAQLKWLDYFRSVGIEAYLWRPADWSEIERALTEGSDP